MHETHGSDANTHVSHLLSDQAEAARRMAYSGPLEAARHQSAGIVFVSPADDDPIHDRFFPIVPVIFEQNWMERRDTLVGDGTN